MDSSDMGGLVSLCTTKNHPTLCILTTWSLVTGPTASSHMAGKKCGTARSPGKCSSWVATSCV